MEARKIPDTGTWVSDTKAEPEPPVQCSVVIFWGQPHRKGRTGHRWGGWRLVMVPKRSAGDAHFEIPHPKQAVKGERTGVQTSPQMANVSFPPSLRPPCHPFLHSTQEPWLHCLPLHVSPSSWRPWLEGKSAASLKALHSFFLVSRNKTRGV